MKQKSKSGKRGICLFGFFFMLFLTLKLAGITKIAMWSWWWVTSQLWIPVLFFLIGFIMFGMLKIGLKK